MLRNQSVTGFDEGTVALLVCIAEELSFVVASVAVAGALLFAARASRELSEVAEFGESLDGPVEHAWKLLLLDFSFKVGVLAVGIAEFDVERDDADAVPDTVGAVGKKFSVPVTVTISVVMRAPCRRLRPLGSLASM